MGQISLVAGQRRFERAANDRMDEPQWVIIGQDFQTNEACGQSCSVNRI